jgi:hypothetical protein
MVRELHSSPATASMKDVKAPPRDVDAAPGDLAVAAH